MKSLVNERDPWVNRSAGMLCQTCVYFVPKVSMNQDRVGRCRANAPTMKGYPVVFKTDWCGNHRLDETKI